MQYRLALDIDAPRARVVELFLDPGTLSAWQPDLVSFETISGTDPRAVGAKSRQVHKTGKSEVVMVETITVHDFPERFAASYEADKVWTLVEPRFTEVDAGTTRWIVDNTFKCGGVVRLMAVLFPAMLRKQTLTFMQRFKDYVESAG